MACIAGVCGGSQTLSEESLPPLLVIAGGLDPVISPTRIEAAVVEVARENCRLVRAGAAPGEGPVTIVGSAQIRAAILPDALKQVLLNLVLNSREVSPDGAHVEILVETRGVGLGLYTAEELVRSAGGGLRASNRTDGPGACFSIELPQAKEA